MELNNSNCYPLYKQLEEKAAERDRNRRGSGLPEAAFPQRTN